MRLSLQLLLTFAQPLLGHSDLGHAQICGLGASLIPPGGPVCLTNPSHLDASENRTGSFPRADSSRCQNEDACGSPRQHAWTHSSPCYQGAESEHQICVFTDASFAGGRGISLVTTPGRASYLATVPAFAKPELVKTINQDLNRTIAAKYEMREIPGKGMGLIAKDYIRRGDLIMANTPSLMIDYRAFNELSKPQYTDLQAHAVDSLPPGHRNAVLNLSAHTSDTTGLTHQELVEKIASTNGFDIDPDDDDDEQHHSFFVVFPEIARMNHDCRPNAEYHFEHTTLAQSIRAARDIFPGEELTLSYINPLMPREQRMTRLKTNWGFACTCPLCAADKARADESDKRIETIKKIKDELRIWSPSGGSRACPEMAELLVSLYEMERLSGSMHEAYMLAALEYNAVGDPWTATKYARLAVEWGIPMVGEGDEDVQESRKLAKDPWGHRSWLRRAQGEAKERD